MESKVRKVVASSSASVYGLAEEFPTGERHHPYANDTLYGAAKVFNEGLLRSFHAMYGLDYVALRYFNVYGPRMDVHGLYTEVLVRWMERIAEGKPPLILGDGLQTMDFIYMGDIARANMLAAETDRTDVVYNVASGAETSLLGLAETLLRVMGSDLPVEHGPARAVNGVTRRLAETELRTRGTRIRGRGRPGGGAHPARGVVARRARRRPGTADPHAGGRVMDIPFSRPTLRGDEGEAVAKVIASGWVSQGPRVREFEAAFAERVGAAEAVAVSNCTTALQLALHVSGVGPGDEVIVPSMSFIATANSVWQCGATPVFADVDPRTFNLDPEAAEAADHGPHQGDHARAPTRPARPTWTRSSASRERHGARARRGRGMCDRRPLPGPADRVARSARVLLAAPAQGHHHWRGRHDRAPGPGGRPRGCASSASTPWTSPTSRATARATWSSRPIRSAAGTTA